jgi:hypothetical protein
MFLRERGGPAHDGARDAGQGKYPENSVLSHDSPFLFSKYVFVRASRFTHTTKSMRP